jgi:hypothetical protein
MQVLAVLLLQAFWKHGTVPAYLRQMDDFVGPLKRLTHCTKADPAFQNYGLRTLANPNK